MRAHLVGLLMGLKKMAIKKGIEILWVAILLVSAFDLIQRL